MNALTSVTLSVYHLSCTFYMYKPESNLHLLESFAALSPPVKLSLAYSTSCLRLLQCILGLAMEVAAGDHNERPVQTKISSSHP